MSAQTKSIETSPGDNWAMLTGSDTLTTSCISLLIRSLNTAKSFFTSPMNAFIFLCISSGVKPSWPTAHRITPNFSLYSLPPANPFTVPATSFVIVPNFALGMRPFGPRILPKPAWLSFCAESTWHRHLSNSIRPSLTASKTTSSPTRDAPAFIACADIGESGGQMTQMRRELSTAWGRRRRLRTAGPFFAVRRRMARSYFGDVGGRPTSKARM